MAQLDMGVHPLKFIKHDQDAHKRHSFNVGQTLAVQHLCDLVHPACHNIFINISNYLNIV